MKINHKILFAVLLVGTLFLTGCKSIEPTDDEIYFVGLIAHDIGDNTPDILQAGQEYGEYSFKYDMPGDGILGYTGFWYFINPIQDIVAGGILPVAAPFVQKVYTYQDSLPHQAYNNRGFYGFRPAFALFRSVSINYIPYTSDLEEFALLVSSEESMDEFMFSPINGEKNTFSFGGHYLPASIDLRYGNVISLDGRFLGGNGTYVMKYTEGGACEFNFVTREETCITLSLDKPTYSIMKNNQIEKEGELVDYYEGWDESKLWPYAESGYDYEVNVTIPAYYSLYNRTYINAKFRTGQADSVPPKLKGIKVPSSYSLNSIFNVNVSVQDDVGVSSVEIYYRNANREWVSISSNKVIDGMNARLNAEVSLSESEFVLKIVVNDTSGNSQSYIIEPIAKVINNIQMVVTHKPETLSPGTLVKFNGSVHDSNGKAVSNLLVRGYYNKNEFIITYTDKYGNFLAPFRIPLDYIPEANLSFTSGEVGTYNAHETVLSGFAQIFDKDVAVLDIKTPRVMYSGVVPINVSYANTGTQAMSGVMRLEYKKSGYYGLFGDWIVLNETSITIGAGQVSEIEFNEIMYSGYGVRIRATIEASEDANVYNNVVERDQQIFTEYSASVHFDASDVSNYIVNESLPFKLIIENNGLKDLSNVNYSIYLAKRTEGVSDDLLDFSNVINGSVTKIGRGQEVEIPFEINLSSQAEYVLRAIINSSQDIDKSDDKVEYWFYVRNRGADLSLYVNYEENNFFAGENISFNVGIYNEGNEESQGATLTTGYREAYCSDESYNTCNNLIGVNQVNISVGPYSRIERDVNFTINTSGEYTFVFKVNSTNDIDRGNDARYIYRNIKDHGPDVAVRYDYDDLYNGRQLYVNEESNLTLIIDNFGDENASNILINTYLYNYSKENSGPYNGPSGESNYYLVNTSYISQLNAGEEKIINVSITLLSKGYTSIYSNLTSNEDTDDNNDYAYFNVLAFSRGLDVVLDNLFFVNRPYVGKANTLAGYVRNVGSLIAEKFNISLSVNEQTIYNQEVDSVGVRESNRFEVEYTSNAKGTLLLRGFANLSGDVDNSDNEYVTNYEVRALKKVNISIRDSAGNPVNRTIQGVGEQAYASNGKTLVEMDVDEDNPEFAIIFSEPTSYSAEGTKFFMTGIGLYGANISERESVVSEFYPSIQDGAGFYSVLANRISFENTSQEREVVVYISELSAKERGMDVNALNDYVIYDCAKFDFIQRRCATGWLESDSARYHQGYKGDSKVYFYSSNPNRSIEAFALGIGSGFNGATTDFANTAQNIISNPVVEKRQTGKIEFIGSVNISRARDAQLVERAIKINHRKIEINTTLLPEFANVPARLLFRSIDLRNPQILRNGASCGSYCSQIVYDFTNKTLKVSVVGFSSYEVVEGLYCGDHICSAGVGETSSTCSADCVALPAVPVQIIREQYQYGGCTATWECTWGPCQNNLENKVCVRKGACTSNRGKPAAETRACFRQSQCVDRDGDGYGQGVDCVGPDVNDNDPAVTLQTPQVITPPKGRSGMSTFTYIAMALGIGVLVLLLLVLVLMLVRKTSNKPTRIEQAKLFIGQVKNRGYSDDEIKNMLRNNGWNEEDIIKAFAHR